MVPFLVCGQSKIDPIHELGFFPVKNFSPEDYKALPQNWAIVQDFRGNIYVANNEGILEFDGTTWRKILTHSNSDVRSLAIDKNSRIYVGATDELGYLQPSSTGKLEFVSLLSKISEAERNFGVVWKTFCIDEQVCFQTEEKLFIYSNDSIQILPANGYFNNSFLVYNKVFVSDAENGLYCCVGDSLQLISGSEELIGKQLYVMLPYRDSTILAAIHETGVFLIEFSESENKLKLRALKTSIDSFLKTNQIYSGAKLSDSLFSIGTFNGAGVVNSSGMLQYWINKQTGLIDENIKFQALDQQKNLWLGLHKGIGQIQVSSPITFFNESHKLEGYVESITRFAGKIHVATSLGVYALNPSKDGALPYFTAMENLNRSDTWITTNYKVARNEMLFIEKNQDIFITDKVNGIPKSVYSGVPWALYQSKLNDRQIYIGVEEGLVKLEFDGVNWNHQRVFPSISSRITDIVEDKTGDLWLSADNAGVYNISRADSDEITFYDSETGLTEGPFLFINFNNELLIGTGKGVMVHDETTNTFVPHQQINQLMGSGLRYIHRMSVDTENKLWLVTYIEDEEREELGFFERWGDTSMIWNPTPFLGTIKGQINALYHDEGGITWLGGSEGLYRFDATIEKNYRSDFYCQIRKVMLGEDSTIFDGAFYDEHRWVSMKQAPALQPVLDYQYNSLVFYYSAMNIDVEQATKYSFKLDGYDKKWSEWTTETKKEYTNLPEKEYVFRVKAKNVYNHQSSEATYVFSVLPPWYRTVWAFLLFGLLGLSLVYFIVISYTRYLRAVIKEKTAEIREQKDEIEKQNEEITASIKYAERIQKAVVPSYERASELLPEHFVLWRPRDIVSGDFWWMTQKNGKVVIVAADCTGHGVPGAFVSMLGVSFLNEIVNKMEHIKANEILNQLRYHVKTTMKQTGKEGEAKDGMDLALVVLDLSVNKIQYAGAYNPLYLIRNGELIEFKADRNPIGIYIKELDSFTNHDIEVQKGDTIYIFSDGYVDQFGGGDGRKFKSKQFKELLLSIQKQSMLEQEMFLDQTIDEWRGNFEQVDDIIIVGIRV
ncbi:MAG: SpoIIE family protein phosphatase [Salinivirgaceae bacterium]